MNAKRTTSLTAIVLAVIFGLSAAAVLGGALGDSQIETTATSGQNQNISGIIYNGSETAPLAGATILLYDAQSGTTQASSDENGSFSFNGLAAGPYLLIVSKEGFAPRMQLLMLNAGRDASRDFVMAYTAPAGYGTVDGYVHNETNAAVSDADVALRGMWTSYATKTNESGYFLFTNVSAGVLEMSASSDFATARAQITLAADATNTTNLTLSAEGRRGGMMARGMRGQGRGPGAPAVNRSVAQNGPDQNCSTPLENGTFSMGQMGSPLQGMGADFGGMGGMNSMGGCGRGMPQRGHGGCGRR